MPVEALGITAKLPSGYHRDLQLLKAPLFRSIDLASDVLAIMAHALPGVRFRRRTTSRSTRSSMPPSEANALVLKEGIPFREAYRRVAAQLSRRKSR